MKILKSNTTLKILNISKNNIDDSCSFMLAIFFSQNETLAEFYIHWNAVSSKGAIEIFEGI